MLITILLSADYRVQEKSVCGRFGHKATKAEVDCKCNNIPVSFKYTPKIQQHTPI